MNPTNETEYIPRDEESEASRLETQNLVERSITMDDNDVRGYSLLDYGFGHDKS